MKTEEHSEATAVFLQKLTAAVAELKEQSGNVIETHEHTFLASPGVVWSHPRNSLS